MLGFIRMLKHFAPDMIAAGGGSIICTGNTSAHRGKGNFGSFAATKCGQRILAESAARKLMPQGIHVAYLTIDAVIAGTPPARMAVRGGKTADFFIQPAAIAHELYHLTQQGKSAW